MEAPELIVSVTPELIARVTPDGTLTGKLTV